MKYSEKNAAFAIASALLLSSGELPVGVIRSLPFVEAAEDCEALIRALLSAYHAEVRVDRISSRPITEWEEVVVVS